MYEYRSRIVRIFSNSLLFGVFLCTFDAIIIHYETDNCIIKAYYGAGWTYIRQYIDKVYATEGIRHSDYKNETAMMYRTDDKAFAAECFELWKSAIEAADTAVAKKNIENSAVQMCAPAQALRDRNNTSYFKNLLVKYGYSTS